MITRWEGVRRRQRQRRARRFLDSKTVRRRCIGNMMDERYKSTGRYKRRRRARALHCRHRSYIYIHIYIYSRTPAGTAAAAVAIVPLLLLGSRESVSSFISPSSTSNCYPLYIDTSVHTRGPPLIVHRPAIRNGEELRARPL